MTDAVARAPAGPQADGPPTSRSVTGAAAASPDRGDSNRAHAAVPGPLAPANVFTVEPTSAVEAAAPLAEPEETPASQRFQRSHPPASQLLHQGRLPIYEWARADARQGDWQRDADLPHKLVRLREESDRAHEKPT